MHRYYLEPRPSYIIDMRVLWLKINGIELIIEIIYVKLINDCILISFHSAELFLRR